MDDDTPTTLYRFFDETGDLLYVGISVDFGRRFTRHADTKDWWHLVASATLEHYPTRSEAKWRERSAIRHEMPAFNIKELEHLKCWARPFPATLKRFPDFCDRCLAADKHYYARGGYDRFPHRIHLRNHWATGFYKCPKCGHEWTCGYTWQAS